MIGSTGLGGANGALGLLPPTSSSSGLAFLVFTLHALFGKLECNWQLFWGGQHDQEQDLMVLACNPHVHCICYHIDTVTLCSEYTMNMKQLSKALQQGTRNEEYNLCTSVTCVPPNHSITKTKSCKHVSSPKEAGAKFWHM